MADAAHIFEATIENFQEKVMTASETTPVLIDVWADWCSPCKQLMPILEKLANEYDGQFLLAKVNADQQQQLTASLGVRSLPTVILVKNGQAVDGFNGALPEGEVRKILEQHVELPPQDPRETVQLLWQEGKLEEALGILTQLNQENPDDLEVLIDIGQLKAELGDPEMAEKILESLPPEEKMQPKARQLAARLKFMKQGGELPPAAELESRLSANPQDPAALHQLALHRIFQDRNAEAMDLLVRSMQADGTYQDGVAKTTLLELFDKLGSADPDVRQYRRKLYTLMH